MTTEEIYRKLVTKFGEESIKLHQSENQTITVSAEMLVEVCQYLHSAPVFYFDSLSCVTGVHRPNTNASFAVYYSLYSIPNDAHLTLKVETNQTVPSLVSVWSAANWQEREVYDLLGVVFEGHPDLRRILLPNDWEGHPLQKDYKEAEKYHGVSIQYTAENPPQSF